MNTDVLLRLLAAHIVADFFLQTDYLCKLKKTRPCLGLPLHSLIQALCSYLCVAEWGNIIIPTVIFATHGIIDWYKTEHMKECVRNFILDQALHIIVIIGISLCFAGESSISLSAMTNTLFTAKSLLIVCVYLLMLKPSSIFLSLLLKQWNVKIKDKSLPNAGKWIGYLERTLVLTFILTNSIEGVGFLLAAKSVFRFGDLNKANDIQVTEYILIGTLTSFAIAIMTGVAITKL